jgi:hypothetical protein
VSAREKLNRRLRPLAIALYGGFGLACVSVPFASTIRNYVAVPVVLGLVVSTASMLAIQFRIRCPFCNMNLGQLALASGRPWGFGRGFNFCPKCGTSLDKEMPT